MAVPFLFAFPIFHLSFIIFTFYYLYLLLSLPSMSRVHAQGSCIFSSSSSIPRIIPCT